MHRLNSAVAALFLVTLGMFQVITRSYAQTSVHAVGGVDGRVESILRQMTLEEKLDYIGGVDDFFIRGVPRLGVPRLKMADGPMGVRNFGPATAFPGGIALAATWDPTLAEKIGRELGRDARAKGVHFLLGPGVNIYRAPMNGRNFEYFGEDPFLASRIAVGYVDGIQSEGVSATIKHFLGNNSEFDRHNTDSVIDERTLREIYLPVFEAAVKNGHVGAIMDSYNLTNGAHMTQNGKLNTDVVKTEWGFKGIIMSDWDATYDAVAAANGGLDLEMPSAAFMNRKNLLASIEDGKVSVATIDDKVRRILRTAIQFGWFDRDQIDASIPRYNLPGRDVALEGARESLVLLKNDGNLLPLTKGKIKSIAVIGPNAYPSVPVGGGSAHVQPFAAVSFMEGMSNALGTSANAYYHRGIPSLGEIADATNFSIDASSSQPGLKVEIFDNAELAGIPATTRIDRHVNFVAGFALGGFNAAAHADSTRWSGYFTSEVPGEHDIFLQASGERGGTRLYVDDMLVINNWKLSVALVNQATVLLTRGPHKIVLEQFRTRALGAPRVRMGITQQGTLVDPTAKQLAVKADAVVVAVGFDPGSESEGGDRTFLLPPGQDELIREMAAANKNTIVVVTSGGSFDAHDWVDRVPALIEAWYPGQEGGTALADLILGNVNPSGRLPITFERQWRDNPVHDSYYPEESSNRIVYKEGVFVGYRGYEHEGAKPLFPFGYGLSYTTFKFANLVTSPSPNRTGEYQVTFDVTNTGNRAGAEVAQIYVGEAHASVPRPPKELKGFSRVELRPGESKQVKVILDGRAFAYYDVNTKHWHADPGDFDILVGSSLEQIELQGKITLPKNPEIAVGQ